MSAEVKYDGFCWSAGWRRQTHVDGLHQPRCHAAARRQGASCDEDEVEGGDVGWGFTAGQCFSNTSLVRLLDSRPAASSRDFSRPCRQSKAFEGRRDDDEVALSTLVLAWRVVLLQTQRHLRNSAEVGILQSRGKPSSSDL
eukprot:3847707-Pleurochrysis_carterae.AAC.1